ncbi:hypothetical protein [Dethiobacter alkaliphilus]|uniref:Uncharacterized protein n=1 Tax=Dethiobacter alkaliphilus AHT 1 TaxID=555088 RepID=C0GGN3_DETAL|nr:hypothetical protein [Dethiobacter alkaliphilus]EEG77474.1 hypothetical protein DealDRAFT_1597 [Dethiobacter alkaliphilus AHT 1]
MKSRTILDFVFDSEMIGYYDSTNTSDMIHYFHKKPELFIYEYLKRGDKIPSELDEEFFSDNNIDRLCHAASIYVLGVFLYCSVPKLKRITDKYLEDRGINEQYDFTRFLYDWFLIAFFHDFGFTFVRKKEKLTCRAFDSKDKSTIRQKTLELALEIMQKSVVVPKPISTSIKNYDAFKTCNYDIFEEFIDHGFFRVLTFIITGVRSLKKSKKDAMRSVTEFTEMILQD